MAAAKNKPSVTLIELMELVTSRFINKLVLHC